MFWVVVVKTEILFIEKPEQITVCKEWENQIQQLIFLSLKEKGLLNQQQYEECLKKLKSKN